MEERRSCLSVYRRRLTTLLAPEQLSSESASEMSTHKNRRTTLSSRLLTIRHHNRKEGHGQAEKEQRPARGTQRLEGAAQM